MSKSKQSFMLAMISLGMHSAAQGQAIELIIDGGFETPVLPQDEHAFPPAQILPAGYTPVVGAIVGTTSVGAVAGWYTTAVNPNGGENPIEIWNGAYQLAEGPGPYVGAQYAEMNSNTASTLFQPVSNIAPKSQLYLSFAHSARDGWISTMRASLFDLGANGTFDSVFATPSSTTATLGGDDSFLLDTLIGPATFTAANGVGNWTQYIYSLPALTSNNMMLAFQSVNSGEGGNFLDAVNLNTVAPIPEPGSTLLLGAGSVLLLRRKRNAKSASI